MSSWLIRMLKTPKTQLGIFLTLIFITAFLNNPSQNALLVFLLSLLSTVLSDLLFVRLRNIQPFFPSASLVTGSIIGLLTGPYVDLYVPIVISAIAMFSKNFLRFGNRHVFNPAAFGLLAGALLLYTPVSWWAVSFQQFFPQSGILLRETIPFLILLSPVLVSLVRMQRYRIALSFLVAYIIINRILNSNPSADGLNFVFDPTIIFFSIVMLPEPMTSPNNQIKQILFGIFVAIISFTVSSPALAFQFLPFNSIDPLVFSLLLGNLVFFKLR